MKNIKHTVNYRNMVEKAKTMLIKHKFTLCQYNEIVDFDEKETTTIDEKIKDFYKKCSFNVKSYGVGWQIKRDK